MEKTRGDAGQQFALGQPVLNQAGMDIDRARHRDTVKRQLLVMNPIRGKTGEQNPDKRDETDDEAQPNHSLTLR
jgi:hypothetical protein